MREWMSPQEVAALIPGVTVRTLKEWRSAGRGPAYVKPSARMVLYDRAAVEAWLLSRVVPTRDQRSLPGS